MTASKRKAPSAPVEESTERVRKLESLVLGDSDEKSGMIAEESNPSEEVETAAWIDSDDEALRVNVGTGRSRLRKLRQAEAENVLDGKLYEERLRQQFQKIHGSRPAWAAQPEEGEEPGEDRSLKRRREARETLQKLNTTDVTTVGDSELAEISEDDMDEKKLLRTAMLPGQKITKGVSARGKTGRVQAKASSVRKTQLPPTLLDIARLPDANRSENSSCVIECMGFHPEGELFFTAGRDKTLRLFHIDGESNPKIASYHFSNFPITEGAFNNNGKEIILLGMNCATVYCYDVQTGNVSRLNPMRGQVFIFKS